MYDKLLPVLYLYGVRVTMYWNTLHYIPLQSAESADSAASSDDKREEEDAISALAEEEYEPTYEYESAVGRGEEPSAARSFS